MVERTLQSAVALFTFVHKHRDLLIRNQRTLFGSPNLKEILEAISKKVKQSAKKRS